MQGNKSVVRLKSVASPLEVNTGMQKSTDGQTSEFSVEMCITYSVGNTLVSLNITEEGFAGRVNVVYIDLSEDSGNGSSANLNLRVTRNDRYGVLCNNMNTKFVGSYDSSKESYCVPPLPDTELVRYFCRKRGSGGCFTLEKKKDENDVAERVKATHDFVVGEETMHVKIKIRNDGRDRGLNVEVEGPVKLTTEYMNHVASRIGKKMKSGMEASRLPLVRNGGGQRPSNGNNGEAVDPRMQLQWLITRTDVNELPLNFGERPSKRNDLSTYLC